MLVEAYLGVSIHNSTTLLKAKINQIGESMSSETSSGNHLNLINEAINYLDTN